MEITKAGKQEVAQTLDYAMRRYDLAKHELVLSIRAVKLARAQGACDHKNLKVTGNYIYITTECKDCGYTWYD